MFPEIEKYATINSRLIANALSENLRFGHYNVMINEIEKEIKSGTDGIIITHGTDTMAYTAAALAFAFENLPVPIILVGAQRSSDRPSSDAALNLISAVQFITKTDFCDVAICMHATTNDDYCHILPACKTRKMHSSARFAFQAVNAFPYTRIWSKEERIEIVDGNYRKRGDVKGKLIVRKFDDNVRVGILKAHPNMLAEEVLVFKGFDGLVIEGTGLGHIGIEKFDEHSKGNEDVEKALRAVIESGTIVVMTTQCLYGRVNMNVYSTGRELIKLGVLGNMMDVLPEVAFIKLAWLLSNFDKEEVKKLLHENLRGEISERSLPSFYSPS
jgi:glutamyl-tRNA(Gln) amidotransferase subunit D